MLEIAKGEPPESIINQGYAATFSSSPTKADKQSLELWDEINEELTDLKEILNRKET